MRTLHVFDMDHTLIEADCDVTWKEFLVKHGIAPREALAEADDFYQDYLRGCMDNDKFIAFQLREFIGKSAAEMAELTQRHFEEYIRHTVRKEGLALVRKLTAENIPAVMLTSTNEVIARPVAEFFGFRDFTGAGLEMIDGLYTGRISGVFPAQTGKIFYLGRFCERYGVEPQNVTAYGDSVNDLPLLEKVGESVAVSPSKVLLEAAEAANWRVEYWNV